MEINSTLNLCAVYMPCAICGKVIRGNFYPETVVEVGDKIVHGDCLLQKLLKNKTDEEVLKIIEESKPTT